MEDFLNKFKAGLENGDYYNWIKFEQSYLAGFGIKHQFEEGETIDIIYEKIEKGDVTFKNDIDFNSFMVMQIKSVVANHRKRLKNHFDGYKEHDELDLYKAKNGELTEVEIKLIEKNHDLKSLEYTVYDLILKDDDEASLCLMLKCEGKQVKEIAQELNMTETEVNNGLRRAHYKLDKNLPDEFKKMRRNN